MGELVIPNDQFEIAYQLFNYGALTSVVISDSVTTIGQGSFRYNTSLTQVTISDSVTKINNFAFYNNQIRTLTIRGSVQGLQNGTFSNNPLRTVNISGSIPALNSGIFNGYGDGGGKVGGSYLWNGSIWEIQE